MASRQMLGLFAPLFIVNRVLVIAGVLRFFMARLAAWGIQTAEPAWLNEK
jgi:hypothetical protein